MTTAYFLQSLDEEEGRQRLRETMGSDHYLMITPSRRPPSKMRTTQTGLKAMGVHADQVFINRDTGKPELIVGRLGNTKKIQVIDVGWEVGKMSRPKVEEKSDWPTKEWPKWPEWPKWQEWPKAEG